MKNLTTSLYLSEQTVFTIAELGILWRENRPDNLKAKVNYYCRSGVLAPLRRGIYRLVGKDYQPLALANRVFIPSYVSLETVLVKFGVVFQPYEAVYSVSYQTRELEIGGRKYVYRKIRQDVLTNPAGIKHENYYTVASLERAFLDTLYLNGEQYFDNLGEINFDICRELVAIYKSRQLEKRLEKYA